MPTGAIRPCIVSGVKPYELVGALMYRDGITTSALAREVKRPKLQPQIHRLRAGKVKNPRYSTIEPLAAHWGVPVEAFWDEAVATKVAKQLALKPAPPAAPDTKRKGRVNRVQAAIDLLDKMTATERREFERLSGKRQVSSG